MEANGQNTTRSAQIKELYVFNSKFGNDTDNEMGKVLYCYPGDTTHPDTQLKEIGLCEAIVKFAQTFNSKEPCDSLHTLKLRHVYYQPEDGYWFILVLSVPSVVKSSPDGVECVEYLDDQIQDTVFHAILKRLYEKFVLLNDKFETMVQEIGLVELRTRLKKCYDIWVQRIDVNQSGIADIFRGLQFLPLSRDAFLRVQCFINHLVVSWPQIKHVVLLQREKLIWSGVDQSHIQLLYDYLVNDLLSQHFLSGVDKQSTFGVIMKRESHLTLGSSSSSTLTQFQPPGSITNSRSQSLNASQSEDDDNASFITASSSHTINGQKMSSKFHMLIYKAEQTYLTILIPGSSTFDRQYISKIEGFLNLNFTSIARDLSKVYRLSSGSGLSNGMDNQSGVKYIYFNNLNFAEKICPGYQCDLEAYKLLTDLKQDLSKMNENGEIITKMVSDNWLVAKVSNKREFYAIFNHKNSNLLEIDEEMRKLTEDHLRNIFFQE
ncbi:vacuolar fusion protein CCZ1 homolog [Folsomia candida]|uniref:Vacuolar fusion protein CCZ1 n=1 Tax=Folsomia candida TaxID=158441 RepID=A0A226EHQ4_FOLCA|nr:vacuolar fusion protein CCZ1 homolog [Folsomia candida]OXA56758.1 Vacuolar fusion protein CCZ1 [Folsomia candida]